MVPVVPAPARRTLGVGLITAATAVMAGCTGGQGDAETSPSGSGSSAPLKDPSAPLVIGSVGTTDGFEGLVEKNIAVAIGEALIDVNANGGVFGRPVTMLPRVQIAGSKPSPQEIVATLKAGKATVVLLSCTDEATFALAPLLASAGILGISVTSTAMQLRKPEDHSKGMLLRLVPSTALMAKHLTEAVLAGSGNGLTPRSAALVVRPGMRGDSLEQQLKQTILPASGQLWTYRAAPGKPFAQAGELGARRPALTIIDAGDDAAAIVKAIRTSAPPQPQGTERLELPMRLLTYATRDYNRILPAGMLKGATGERPGAPWSDPLRKMMIAAEISMATSGFDFCAQAYDAVVLAALGASVAHHLEGSQIAAAIPTLLAGGTAVPSFAEAARAIRSSGGATDLAYVGFSGKLALRDGELSSAQISTITYRDDNVMGDTSASEVTAG